MKNRLNIIETNKVMFERKNAEKELENGCIRSIHCRALTAKQFAWTSLIIWGFLLCIGISLSFWASGWQAVFEIHYAILAGTLYNLPIIIVLLMLIGGYNLLRIGLNKRIRKKQTNVRHRIEVLDAKLNYSLVPFAMLKQVYLEQMVKMKKESGTPDEEIILLFENFRRNEKADDTIFKQKENNVIYLDSVK